MAFNVDFNKVNSSPIENANKAMDGIKESMQGIVGNSSKVGMGIKNSMKTSPVDKMRDATNSLKDRFKGVVAESTGVNKAMEKLRQTKAIQFLSSGMSKVSSSITKAKDKAMGLSSTFDKIKTSKIGEKVGTSIGKMRGPIDKIISLSKTMGNKLVDGMTRFKKSITNSMKELEKLGKGMQSVGKTMMTRVTAPIVALGTASIHTVMKFDDSMSQIQAITGATSSQFESMRELAKDLGSTTAHSASAAADGMSILAASGKKTNEILDMTPHLLSLASAGNLELDQSASILTGTMAMFNLGAKEAERVTNVMAKAASSANTNIAEIGSAMEMAGGSAYSMNMDIEQTNAVLGLFANQNLTGSRAGTAFTAMFTDLSKGAKDGAIAIGSSKVAVYDASGAMRDMGSIMADVEGATKGMSDAQKDSALQGIFGVQSMKGVNAILTEGSAKYNEMEEAIYNSSGAASQMADDMENNIGGAFRSMKSAIEGFMIDMGDVFKDDVAKIAKGIGALAGMFGKLPDSAKKSIVVFLGVAAAIGPIIFIIGTLITKVMAMGPALLAVKGAFGVLMGPAGIIIALVIGLIATITHLWKTNEEFKDKVISVWETVKGSVGAAIEFMQNLWETHGESIKTTLTNVFNIVQNIFIIAMGIIMGIITVALGVIKIAWSLFGDTLMSLVSVAWETIQSVISGVMNVIQGVIDVVLGVISGNWGQAWEGMKQVFGGIFEALAGIAKGAMNGVISIINGALGGLNKIKLPDWVPGLGGKGINIPLIPKLAKGTDNWKGGIVQVHEEGGEIIDLPGGSRVYPHDKSVDMARKQGAYESAANASNVFNNKSNEVNKTNNTSRNLYENITKNISNVFNKNKETSNIKNLGDESTTHNITKNAYNTVSDAISNVFNKNKEENITENNYKDSAKPTRETKEEKREIIFNPVYNIEISGTATEQDKQEVEKIIEKKTRELLSEFFKEMNMTMG